MPPPMRRPFKDSERYYAYVWRLDGEVLWVGLGHALRGVPSRKNITGRPQALADVLSTRWKEIVTKFYGRDTKAEAARLEVGLTKLLKPKYNTAVGFAGHAGHTHSDETKKLIGLASKGRSLSALGKLKSSQRMSERNRTSPPRKGKPCSPEHRRKLSEAARRRSNHAS